ncbi:hypothetical protein A3Q56_01144 [Intoshia linei]|uniref:Uncharacterized protein n=1 Tax=Intoshia linei TaxID=1819745 RepID=A0A177B9X3_9BILA|nr:hypothetical protein A3Q56_01144 [Intoshia linei]
MKPLRDTSIRKEHIHLNNKDIISRRNKFLRINEKLTLPTEAPIVVPTKKKNVYPKKIVKPTYKLKTDVDIYSKSILKIESHSVVPKKEPKKMKKNISNLSFQELLKFANDQHQKINIESPLKKLETQFEIIYNKKKLKPLRVHESKRKIVQIKSTQKTNNNASLVNVNSLAKETFKVKHQRKTHYIKRNVECDETDEYEHDFIEDSDCSNFKYNQIQSVFGEKNRFMDENDLSDMDVGFHDIQKEEYISSKIARYEDEVEYKRLQNKKFH